MPSKTLLSLNGPVNQSFRASLLLATTIGGIFLLGCKPTAPTEDAISEDAPAVVAKVDGSPAESSSSPEKAEPKEERIDQDRVGESVVIRGELQSVDWQSMVGRKLTVEGDLVVVDTYDLLRRGQVKVARSRLYVPTSRVDPNDADPNGNSFEGGSNVAKVTEAQKANDQAVITLDDGSADQNIYPPMLFPELGKTQETVRVGMVINGFSGRMVQAGSRLLLVPDEPLKWTPAPRPQRPSVGDADITVASYNVLNYFSTIDDGNNNARGADSASELERQEEKLVSAITALQSDVIGLMELENNVEAEERLIAALNRSLGKEVFKGCGIPDGFDDAPGGTDSIRVGIIYRSDRVTPVGACTLVRDDAFFVARTPIVQTFQSKAKAKPFTVIVNHFKSKGGADSADKANKNKGDGQAAYNAARRAQSLAICKYIGELEKNTPKSRVLVIGDLNAYQQEDPVDAMRANGLIDLTETFGESSDPGNAETHYSFVYYGQSGSLDHALATEALASDVTGIATWHINADEPRFLDYNEEFVPKTLFKVNPYRSSDHDPVLIGIRQ